MSEFLYFCAPKHLRVPFFQGSKHRTPVLFSMVVIFPLLLSPPSLNSLLLLFFPFFVITKHTKKADNIVSVLGRENIKKNERKISSPLHFLSIVSLSLSLLPSFHLLRFPFFPIFLFISTVVLESLLKNGGGREKEREEKEDIIICLRPKKRTASGTVEGGTAERRRNRHFRFYCIFQ